MDKATTSVRDIRDVAPNKHMGCATFVLPLAPKVLKKKKKKKNSVTACVQNTESTHASKSEKKGCEDVPIAKKARLHSNDE